MNDNPKPISDAELVGMMQRNQKALREQISALEAELAKLRAGQEPVAWAAQNVGSGKYGYIWHEESDVRGWINLQHQSDNSTWRGPIALYTTPQPSAVPDGWSVRGCDCSGLCKQRGLASDEVDADCRAVYGAQQPSAVPADAASIAEEIDWLIRQWDAKVSWSGERMAELLEAAGKAAAMLAAAPSAPDTVQGDAVRASLSADNQRISPPEPIIAKPHPLAEIATAQGVNQQLLEAIDEVRRNSRHALGVIGGIRHGENINAGELWRACEYLDAAIAAARQGGGKV